MRLATFAFSLAVGLGLAAVAVATDAPTLELSHEGYLLGADDAPVSGAHSLHVALWRDRTSTNPADLAWSDDFLNVEIDSGRYAITLGDRQHAQKPLTEDVFDTPVYLSVTIDEGPELLPRLAFSTMPLAAHADRAATADLASDLACATPGCVGTTDLAPASVTTDVLAPNAVTTDQLAAGAVTADRIAAGAVTTDLLATAAVTTDRIAAGAVTTDRIAARAVTTDRIAAGAVTTDLLAANAVTTDRLAANAVTTDRLAANAVTTDRLAANAVTTDRLAPGAVTLDRLALTDGKMTGLDADSVDGRSSEQLIWNGTAPQAASLNLTGSVTATTATFSGAVQAGSLQTGTLAASSLSTSGEVSASQLTVSGAAQLGGPLAVGSQPASRNAALDLQATNKGFLPPRLSATQRDALSAPEAGLMVFNTTTKEMNFFDGTSWRSMVSGFSVRRAHVDLSGPITLHEQTPTYEYDLSAQKLPANTKAVMVGLYFLYNGSPGTHGYLTFWAYQRGKVADSPDAALFDDVHFDWYYNSDYYELIVPWDKSMNDDTLTVQVTNSYNSNTNNVYRIYFAGYITAN